MSGWNQRPRSFTTVILDLDFIATMIACLHAIGFNAIQRNYRGSRNRPSSSSRIFFRHASSKHGLCRFPWNSNRSSIFFFFFLLYDLDFLFGIRKIGTRFVTFFLKITLHPIRLFIVMGLCLLNLYSWIKFHGNDLNTISNNGIKLDMILMISNQICILYI